MHIFHLVLSCFFFFLLRSSFFRMASDYRFYMPTKFSFTFGKFDLQIVYFQLLFDMITYFFQGTKMAILIFEEGLGEACVQTNVSSSNGFYELIKYGKA